MAENKAYDTKKETAALVEKALAGRGFVMFVGVQTDKKDAHGNYILDFKFTRNKLPLEDLPKAVDAFREHCTKDAMKILGIK